MIALATWGLLRFSTNFSIFFFLFLWGVRIPFFFPEIDKHKFFHFPFWELFHSQMEFLLRIALNLYMTLGSMGILTILILLIHEHEISFHLFVS